MIRWFVHVLSGILSQSGYEVHLAGDGLEGLRTFGALNPDLVMPDLVITNIVMPVKGGLDTIEVLRTWSPEAQIVAISGGSRVGNKDFPREVTELGAAAFIAKPFGPDELLATVPHCLAS